MNRDELARRLGRACESVIAARDELTEIDSRFGDADHGITMEKIAQAVAEAVAASGGGINAMLGDAAMEVMMINGGSAVPLWNTWLDGLAEAAPRAASWTRRASGGCSATRSRAFRRYRRRRSGTRR